LIKETFLDAEFENPLIWPLLTILQSSPQSYKVHYLATELGQQGLLPDLDKDPNKALFKRNFLLMNALYQLQALLLPDQWLQIQSLDIQLMSQTPNNVMVIIERDAALRSYYLDWTQFDTSSEEIDALLGCFWKQFGGNIGKSEQLIDKKQALKIFELNSDATTQAIRRQWRVLALKWHPDRPGGDTAKFRVICEAWKVLSGH
jgi:hypothetical protein